MCQSHFFQQKALLPVDTRISLDLFQDLILYGSSAHWSSSAFPFWRYLAQGRIIILRQSFSLWYGHLPYGRSFSYIFMVYFGRHYSCRALFIFISYLLSASVHEYLICPDKHGVGSGDGVLFYFFPFKFGCFLLNMLRPLGNLDGAIYLTIASSIYSALSWIIRVPLQNSSNTSMRL